MLCATGSLTGIFSCAAAEPVQPQEYTITYSAAGPDWETIPELSVGNVLWQPDCGIRAKAQFCYDEEYLYVHLQAEEQEVRAEYTEPLSPVYKDSCLEFFFMPQGEDRYFNFEINPNGCLYIGFGHGRADSTVLYREDLRELFHIGTETVSGGWGVYYQIPLKFLQLFYPGYRFEGILRANVYKCGDETADRHYLAWNPVLTEKPDFHRPEYFGEMTFAGEEAGSVSEETAEAAETSGESVAETAWYEEPAEEPEEISGEDVLEEDWTIDDEGTVTMILTSIRKGIQNRNYILKNSDTQFLEWSDVKGLTAEEIRMARNEIYARHGYTFKKKQVLNYFKAKKWYKAETDPASFKAEKVFNEAEKYNVKYLESLEPVAGLANLGTVSAKKKVEAYGFENGYSRLSFKLKKGSLVKKNGYYEVTAVYRQAVTVPGNLMPGDSVRVSFDDIRRKKLTLVRDDEGLYVKEDPVRTFMYYNQSGKVTLYEDSADRVDKPVYEGKLYIREDAVEGRWLGKTRSFRPQVLQSRNLEFNAVTFDSKGYAVRLMYIGD